jgi:hypothetical protein
MGEANVRRWVPEIMPLLLDGDPLGVDEFVTLSELSAAEKLPWVRVAPCPRRRSKTSAQVSHLPATAGSS